MSEKLFIESKSDKKVFCPYCKKQLKGEVTVVADDKQSMGYLFLIGSHLKLDIELKK